MPAIKYKDKNGQWQILNQVMVNQVNVVQTTGTSSADVMSQNAVTEALENVHIDVDQVIDSTTSGSSGAVSTSAVYGFVTSYTPSITVDQTIDSTTSGSSNPVATKAVYSAITNSAEIEISSGVSPTNDNIEIWIDESEDMFEMDNFRSSSAVTAMTGYVIASSGSSITTSDSLNEAIAKLEKRIADLESQIAQVEPAQTLQQVQGKNYYEIV